MDEKVLKALKALVRAHGEWCEPSWGLTSLHEILLPQLPNHWDRVSALSTLQAEKALRNEAHIDSYGERYVVHHLDHGRALELLKLSERAAKGPGPRLRLAGLAV